MVTYPILLNAPVGESGIMEVFRVSPEDAPGIFNQRTLARKKLLGTKFGNFGAFFDKNWRENDMLWGRLDGAECLINAVLPEDTERKRQLLVEAQDAILRDDDIFEKLKDWAIHHERNPDFPPPLNGRSELIECFKEYQVDNTFPPEKIQRLALRTAPVLSMVLKSMLNRRQYLRLFVVWIPRAARVYNAVLKARTFLRLPWRLRKQPALAKKSASV
jgi:hypothetical protein